MEGRGNRTFGISPSSLETSYSWPRLGPVFLSEDLEQTDNTDEKPPLCGEACEVWGVVCYPGIT